MEWTEDFETGLPELDQQHRELHVCIQRLESMAPGSPRDDVALLLDRLERLSRAHFAWEERRGAESHYPGLERHALEHAQLLTELESHRRSQAFSPRQLARVLSNWLVSHTLMEDRPFARHLESRDGPKR